MKTSKVIYNYNDYRIFLKDFYNHFKSTIPCFSYRLLSEKAGFSNPSIWKLLIEGKKNLGLKSIDKVAYALNLNKKAREYFKCMVLYTQAKNLKDQEYYLNKLDTYKKREKNKLLPKNKHTPMINKSKEISTSSSINYKKYHIQMIDHAKNVLSNIDAQKRSITNTTLSISEETLKLILERAKLLKKEIEELVESNDKDFEFYELNINIFPLVKNHTKNDIR